MKPMGRKLGFIDPTFIIWQKKYNTYKGLTSISVRENRKNRSVGVPGKLL